MVDGMGCEVTGAREEALLGLGMLKSQRGGRKAKWV